MVQAKSRPLCTLQTNPTIGREGILQDFQCVTHKGLELGNVFCQFSSKVPVKNSPRSSRANSLSRRPNTLNEVTLSREIFFYDDHCVAIDLQSGGVDITLRNFF